MGNYYARKFFEKDEVAIAIEESYMPLSEGSKIPITKTGIVVALSDRMDSLSSYIGIGLIPTSSKDPYALRRAAIGVLRILIETQTSMDLRKIISEEKVLDFVISKMKGVLTEYGFSSADIEMCGVYSSFDPYNIYKCVEAISNLAGSSKNFVRLLEVYKRIKGSVGEEKNLEFSEKKLEAEQEKELYKTIISLEIKYKNYLKNRNYSDAFETLTELINPLESFFDNVRVQVEEESLKKNRVALLQIPYKWISSTLELSK